MSITYSLICFSSRIFESKVNKILEEYAKKFDLPIKESHCIRRSYASFPHERGTPLETIRMYLGHSSIQTTAKYLFDIHYDESQTNQLNSTFDYVPTSTQLVQKEKDDENNYSKPFSST